MNQVAKVLYIDDDRPNLEAFRSSFKDIYDIEVAVSSEQGLELMKNHQFHILLVDQRMPKSAGIDFFANLPEQYDNCVRILISAYSDAETIIGAINKGKVYKYVSKPYRREDLKVIIDEAFEFHQNQMNRYNDYNKYKELFRNSNDSIFLIDNEGKIIDVNDTCLELLSTTREEIINRRHDHLFDTQIIGKKMLVKLRRENLLENVEIHLPTGEEDFIDCLISLKRISIPGGTYVGYQGIIKNISNYKSNIRSSVRQLIQKQEKEKEEASFALHERSAQNLSGIKFYLNMLANQKELEESKEVVASVKKTLDSTIKDLRNVCFELMPSSLSYDIEGPLADFCQKIEKAYGIECKAEVMDNLSYLSKDLRIFFFHVIQEIINCLKKTENIHIKLKVVGSNLTIDVQGVKAEISGSTLEQIYTQIDSYNGRVQVNTFPENQVRYRASFPVQIAN